MLLSPTASTPWIVALDRAGHAARTAAAAHQFRALERDHRAVTLADPILAGEERRARHDAKPHARQLLQRRFIALIRQDDARSHRDEVAPRRPLLALLHRASIAA